MSGAGPVGSYTGQVHVTWWNVLESGHFGSGWLSPESLTVTSLVTLGESPNLSEPWFLDFKVTPILGH